ncbi:MAG TPA: hypothetical protein ENN05_07865 [Deltaproteobacteria bacterium]|nr:hypothetical protein [Deltaproteobacteria bacterium]
MRESITIARRFCGPSDSGNGGYVCGLLARYIDGTAEVMLRQPPPLEQPLIVERDSGKMFLLKSGDTVIARAGSSSLDLDVPQPPTYAEAKRASKGYIGFHSHPFPLCFVCGPDRSEGDGLRIFPGSMGLSDIVASAWVPDESLADDNGYVRDEFIWASLDCPGAFAVIDRFPVVLGKLTAHVTGRVQPGQRCVATGWKIAREGRKLHAGTAVFSENGDLLGRARAVWIEIDAGKAL